MKRQSNEQLCALAQNGDKNARNLLLENNIGFISKTANEIYVKMNLGESELVIDRDDLEQEGCIGLLNAIPRFDGEKGIRFLTYAAPFIRNTMIDFIRRESTDGLALQKIRLDEVIPGDEQMLRIEAIADSNVKSPEKICIEKETLRELYGAMDKIGDREQTYLLYRYGFTDDVEHTLTGTATHFNLSESRAKKIEEDAMDNLRLELPWWS
ncbi:MAG: sigma-70 family RNA polymerase sigma factor [Oscillospiraceae bacterium]|nr:sigma-70 family RNA polymerase sigma factor [Oscillospiraceae bacterium]